MYKTPTLTAEDARTIQMLGMLGNTPGGQGQGRDTNNTVDKSTSTGARSSNDTSVNMSSNQRQALGIGLGMLGVPYAGAIVEGVNNASTGNTQGLKNQAANMTASTVLGMLNPALGIAASQLSVGEMALMMAEYDTTLSEAFAATNPKTAAALNINQPDKEKNQERLDKAIEAGKALGFTDNTNQGMFDAAMAGFAGANADRNSEPGIDRDQDPGANTSSMSDKDI